MLVEHFILLGLFLQTFGFAWPPFTSSNAFSSKEQNSFTHSIETAFFDG